LLYYPIDKTEVPILYNLGLEEIFKNDPIIYSNPKQKGGLGVGKSIEGTLNLITKKRSS